MLAKDKHSSLFLLIAKGEEKSFIKLIPRVKKLPFLNKIFLFFERLNNPLLGLYYKAFYDKNKFITVVS